MADVLTMIDALGGVRKTAAALGVPPTTVQHWKDKGEAPAWRIGDLASAYAKRPTPAHERSEAA